MLRTAAGQGPADPRRRPASRISSTKTGTPTMGGLMILLGIVVSTVLWANPRNPYVWIVLGVTLGFGLVGFYDDYLKVTRQTPRRLRRRARGSSLEARDRARAPAIAHRQPRPRRRSRPRWRFRSSRT